MASQSLEQLRREVRARHAAATKKVSRIRRSSGIELAGTKHDVRRDAKNIGRYNRAQLTTYLRELNTFQQRSTSFVAGAEGAVFTRQQAARFEDAKRRINLRADFHAKRRGETFIDPLGKTINERRADRATSNFRRVGGDSTPHVFGRTERDIRNIRSPEKLDEIIRGMERKLSGSYVKSHMRMQREQFRQMGEAIGIDPDYLKLSKRLTDEQFSIFWNETNAAELMGSSYWTTTNVEESRRRALSGMLEVNNTEVQSLIDWASRL